ncbi:hypothetical protein Tco_0688999, partial [Tanacetum coccineum]
ARESNRDENSARVIMDSLEEFKNASGLTPSLPKSTALFLQSCRIMSNQNPYVFSRLKKVWPTDWLVKYPPLANIVVPNLTNVDCSTWLNLQNIEVGYSVAVVWECIRLRNNEIDWFNVVWFNHQIPRQAIHLWLPDTHEHLFFKCLFCFEVWECVKSLTSITGIPSALNSIVDFIIPLAHRKSARSVTLKLVFAAAC